MVGITDVDVEKGFTYSAIDRAYVCQKKNHFQLSVNLSPLDSPTFVQPAAGGPLQQVGDC
jgi:hypothetical protein